MHEENNGPKSQPTQSLANANRRDPRPSATFRPHPIPPRVCGTFSIVTNTTKGNSCKRTQTERLIRKNLLLTAGSIESLEEIDTRVTSEVQRPCADTESAEPTGAKTEAAEFVEYNMDKCTIQNQKVRLLTACRPRSQTVRATETRQGGSGLSSQSCSPAGASARRCDDAMTPVRLPSCPARCAAA